MKKNQNTIIIAIILTIILSTISAMAVTISGGSSSYTFGVNNCTATPMTELNCSSSTIRYQCDFTNIAFIDHVDYRINGIDYLTTQNSTTPTQFYLYYNKPTDINSNNTPLTFDRQTVTDVDNKKLNANIPIIINHTCEACNAQYTNSPIESCQINNTQLYQYISSNQTCQPNYNTTETCNYCNPYVVANTTSCSLNNTKKTVYNDLNFASCCQTTLLAEDCPTLYYPYNQELTTTCQYYQTDFTCNLDEKPVIDDKINVNCELPEENACCVINVYQNQNGTRTLLQTSPEYRDTKNTIFGGQIETRTCFPTTSRLLNAYYTNKELRPNTYELEILCTSNTTSYRTIKEINPIFKTIDQPINRIKWVGDNPATIILWLIIGFIALIILAYILSKLRGR